MTRVYLGLGSNEGDRIGHLRAGISALVRAEGVHVIGVSGAYHSEPLGVTEQPDFLNAVVEVETSKSPHELLHLAQEIEKERGRRRVLRWGPRTLDVDILLFGQDVLDEPDLTIPHPRLTERRFVVEPLFELAPEATLPDGRTVGELKDALGEDQVVWRESDVVMGP